MTNKLHSVILPITPPEGHKPIHLKGWAIGTRILAISDYGAPYEIPIDQLELLITKYNVVVINNMGVVKFSPIENVYHYADGKVCYAEERRLAKEYLCALKFEEELEELLSI